MPQRPSPPPWPASRPADPFYLTGHFTMQSPRSIKPPFHVAIIMDGNGRWATRRGLPRTAGHHEGVKALRRACEAAPDLGITTLTVFGFSTYNWTRPQAEVAGLMKLFGRYMRDEAAYCRERGARL